LSFRKEPFLLQKLIALASACFLALGLMAGCGPVGILARRPAYQSNELQFQTPQADAPVAVFHTTKGDIKAVLYPEQAPMAVENFTQLAQQGYYNNTSFHRIMQDFVVQGGDATGTGTGGSTIWNNNPYPKEISDALHHYSGALCIAFSPDEEVSGLSQFYFVQSLPEALNSDLKTQLEQSGTRTEVLEAYDAVGGLPYLDYTDTVFGQVYQGMNIVDKIAQTEVDENGKPTEDVIVNSITISTYQADSSDAVSSSASSATESTASSAAASDASTASTTSGN
jgi:peptidyl-prolyl cis-trans isomerase B (cyclophilin B)